MPGADDGLGKKAEGLIKTWLDQPDQGYSFDRIPDQMSGYYKVSRNICDFICFKSPNIYYIESKATWKDRFDFSMITETQSEGLHEKNKIEHAYALVMVLFASQQRAFIFNIDDIRYLEKRGIKSLNIKKIDNWPIKYVEVETEKDNRKTYLNYTEDLTWLPVKLGVLFLQKAEKND